MQFPRKITVASMGFDTRTLEEIAESSKEKPVSILRIWGLVSGKKSDMTQYGPYSLFSGELAAMNLVTGEEARSQKLILPPQAESLINMILDKALKDGGSAQIALEIQVEYNNSAKGGVRFRYGVKPLIETKGDDALSLMAKSLPAPVMLKALPDKSNEGQNKASAKK